MRFSINQTTLEHMSHYDLLRHLPPPPSSGRPAHFPPPPSSPLPHQKSQPSLARPPTPSDSDFGSPIDSASHSLALYPYPSSQDTIVDSPPLRYRPPDEHDLTHDQRRCIRYHHARIRMYDLGWRRNCGEVFGGGKARPRWRWWVRLLMFGGWPRGDGWIFEKTKGVDKKLERVAKELDELGQRDRNERVGR